MSSLHTSPGVLVGCAHRFVRDAVAELVRRDTRLAVLGEAADGEHVLALVREYHAPVLVLDTALPPVNAADLLTRIGHGDEAPRVVAFSAEPDPSFLGAAAHDRVYGYLTLHEPATALAEAIEGASQNVAGWFSRDVGRAMQLARNTGASGDLTHREREVLRLLADGHTNDGAADALGLSALTVKRHVSNALAKTNTLSRAAAIAWALRNGAIH